MEWILFGMITTLIVVGLYFARSTQDYIDEQNETHFEIQDSNKAKAYEEQKAMREELIEWVKTCDKLHMGELFSEMRRMKRSWE